MTEAQRRMLWRQAMKLGYKGDEAAAFLSERLRIDNGHSATKREASRLIDELETELEGGVSGNAP